MARTGIKHECDLLKGLKLQLLKLVVSFYFHFITVFNSTAFVFVVNVKRTQGLWIEISYNNNIFWIFSKKNHKKLLFEVNTLYFVIDECYNFL